jgi:hypothetical protein
MSCVLNQNISSIILSKANINTIPRTSIFFLQTIPVKIKMKINKRSKASPLPKVVMPRNTKIPPKRAVRNLGR